MKHPISLSLLLGATLLSNPAFAQDRQFHSLSSNEQQQFQRERENKWDALSDSEKVQIINERRAQRRKAMDDRWDAMSDGQKVKFAEEHMQRRQKHRSDVIQ